MEKLSYEIGWNPEVYVWDIRAMILQANSTYRRMVTPGTWPQEDEVCLTPGVDFKRSEYDTNDHLIYWQEYMDEAVEFGVR